MSSSSGTGAAVDDDARAARAADSSMAGNQLLCFWLLRERYLQQLARRTEYNRRRAVFGEIRGTRPGKPRVKVVQASESDAIQQSFRRRNLPT